MDELLWMHGYNSNNRLNRQDLYYKHLFITIYTQFPILDFKLPA